MATLATLSTTNTEHGGRQTACGSPRSTLTTIKKLNSTAPKGYTAAGGTRAVRHLD